MVIDRDNSVSAGALVRPYAVTRGRTRPRLEIAMEALVETTARGRTGGMLAGQEQQTIAGMCVGLQSMAEIAARLAQGPPPASSGKALLDQNRELLTLLSELRAREAELQSLNAELEETNRGVLVLYAELEDKALAVQQASEMKTRF